MGRYIDSQMGPGEHIVYEAKVHWMAYASAIKAAAGALFFLVEGVGASPTWQKFFYLASFLCMGVALRSGAGAYLAIRFTEVAVTNKRVIAKFRFFGRSTDEQPLSKIERCMFDQSLLGRAFGFGGVTVQGVGGHSIPIPCIAEPIRFKEQVLGAIPQPETAPTASA